MQKKLSGGRDEHFMRRALSLARRGTGSAHPNPLVGAVLVRNGRILAAGTHRQFGKEHAEAAALAKFRGDGKNCTLYTNLEPCSHFGKTPPCADLILKRGIGKVVAGMVDPNPRVRGRGIRRLKRGGVRVELGVLKAECEALNRDFKHWILKKRPYVVVKAAQTLDGKIASASGRSKWITGEAARRKAHSLRAESDAVLVGVNTVIRDNPRLTARVRGVRRQPLKVVLDSDLRTPIYAKLFASGRTLIFTSAAAFKKKAGRFRGKAEIVVLPEKKRGYLNWDAALRALAKKGVVRLLVEGGGEVLSQAILEGRAQEIFWFLAPKIMGGKSAVPSVAGRGVSLPERAPAVRQASVQKVGADFLIHGFF